MYRVALKTAVVEALQSVFTSTHPNPDFRPPNSPMISIEFPVENSFYPGIWVQYADNSEVSIAGIGHEEQSVDTDAGTFGRHSRWKFSGSVTLTIVALSSYERDRLWDEMVRIFIGARYNPLLASFREKVEENDLVGININFDDIEPSGEGTPMGTPWGTDEIIYEASLSFDLQGEFVTDQLTTTLVPLSKVTYMNYVEGAPEPPWPGPGSSTEPSTPGDWDRTQWT